jgi:glyoxylase-like metal-dependent hydrolase (beta-lactamase superfamily II)
MAVDRRSVLGAVAILSTLGRAQAARAEESRNGARVVLLGTAGGPSPKPSRSAPASMVVVNNSIYVVDCGNGVARQIVRAGFALKDLKGIFITHQHSDHNLDQSFLSGVERGIKGHRQFLWTAAVGEDDGDVFRAERVRRRSAHP